MGMHINIWEALLGCGGLGFGFGLLIPSVTEKDELKSLTLIVDWLFLLLVLQILLFETMLLDINVKLLRLPGKLKLLSLWSNLSVFFFFTVYFADINILVLMWSRTICLDWSSLSFMWRIYLHFMSQLVYSIWV